MPLLLGYRHVDVPLKEKLELIPLKPLVLMAGRRIENFLSSHPQQPSSFAPCRACLHGALVPNCPKQRAMDYVEHTMPICLIPTFMDHTHPRYGTSLPFSARDVFETRGRLWAAGRLQNQNAVSRELL